MVSAASGAREISLHNLILVVKWTEADMTPTRHSVTTQLQLWALENKKENAWGITVAKFLLRRVGLSFLSLFIARNQNVLFIWVLLQDLAFNGSWDISESVGCTFSCLKETLTSVLPTTRDNGWSLSSRGQHLRGPALWTQGVSLRT